MTYKVYKIKNNIDGKFYIGVTKISLENRFNQHQKADSYIGRAIKKYGVENFSIEVVYEFDSEADMYNKEAEIVNEDFLRRDDVYNLKLGGQGGFDHLNDGSAEHILRCSLAGQRCQNREASIEKFMWLLENDKEWAEKRAKKISDSINKRYTEGWGGSFKDKKHSTESKQKIGEANSMHQSGKGNSQFGTMWVYNLEEQLNKKIKKDEFPTWEQEGWLKGRKSF